MSKKDVQNVQNVLLSTFIFMQISCESNEGWPSKLMPRVMPVKMNKNNRQKKHSPLLISSGTFPDYPRPNTFQNVYPRQN